MDCPSPTSLNFSSGILSCFFPWNMFLCPLFCLTCCFYFYVAGTYFYVAGRLVIFPDLREVAFCRRCPMSPSSALLSCCKGEGSAGPRVGSDLHLGTQSAGCSVQFSSVAQSFPTLQPHGLQHARLPCPSPTPRAYSNSCAGC